MSFLINTFFDFLLLLLDGWKAFRQLSVKTQVMIGLILVTIIGFVYFVHQKNQEKQAVEKELQRQKEAEAQRQTQEINQAKESVNKSETEANKIIQTDSNKFSRNGEELTNKFCDYYCRQGILDSTCSEWAKKNNRICN